MTAQVKPIEIFYSYAHEDEALRNKLNTHLSTLRRQGLITSWHDRQITAGSLWADEIDTHLKTAQIILLLISPDFINSDYCYSVELEQALIRHTKDEACVIPIILRPVDLKDTAFAKLQALPKDAKPVVNWPRQDDAFLNIAQGIRAVVEKLNGTSPQQSLPSAPNKGKMPGKKKTGGEDGGHDMEDVSLLKLTPKLKIAVTHYYDQLEEYVGKADYELAVRSAFQYLLAEFARAKNWTLLPEQTLQGNIRPDGTLHDNAYELPRGYWEAKGPKSDLDKEIEKKIKDGYPLTNIIFENTKRAVLYQNKKRAAEFDLTKRNDLIDLLRQFFSHTEPSFATFEVAVKEFKERIPELAQKLLSIIQQEHKLNKKFIAAFETFAQICRTSLNPKLSDEAIDEMLVQHLLTVRLFRTVFNNTDFTSRNVIASEIEKVITALTSRSFSLNDFLQPLDRFYVAIEAAAKELAGWTERQHFLNTVYERFFQGFSVEQADTYGVVYTPQQIVDFMCASVDEILKQEFGTSLSEPGVQIIDPATGTGSFIVNLLHRIQRSKLKYKYQHDLFCNEIMLLPYYIASLNIEHEYYKCMGEYEPFGGICFVDTLTLAEKLHSDGKETFEQPTLMMVEANTERVQREKAAQIMVVIGNPPYNIGQKNENDNNKNREYPVMNQRVRETYAKDSHASNKNALQDVYVKFFRWAVDRLQNRDGIVCLITNNSFVDDIAFDGMRMHLQKDFTRIYHIDLHGNVRENPKLSGTTHNVFGIQLGVGITIAIRSSKHSSSGIYYYRMPEFWRKTEKLAFLQEKKSLEEIDWQELHPDERSAWLTEGVCPEFYTFIPIGSKEAKIAHDISVGGKYSETFFKIYSLGAQTSRDSWMYAFDKKSISTKTKKTIDTYNVEVSRWIRAKSNQNIDDFVTKDETKIKWSSRLKEYFNRKIEAKFEISSIRHALYRPFTRQFLYFDNIMTHRQGAFPNIFPKEDSESENVVICVQSIGAGYQTVIASNIIVDYKCGISGNSGIQCFPFYTYSEDGSNRRQNITDWSLNKFQEKYGTQVSKWNIFHFVYAMLHHPQYRQLYAENLKRDLPHIPLLERLEAFEVCVRIGKQLMDLHVQYESAKEYPLTWVEDETVPFSWHVEKMRLTPDKSSVIINKSLTLARIPQECFEYRLGNRSALEWVIDQYQVSKDTRSGIESDPNNLDDEAYIVHLVERVVTVSVETVCLVNELAQAVTMEDWLGEQHESEQEELASVQEL